MRAATAFTTTAREYARTPLLLALLVAVPAYVVGVITRVAPEAQLPITIDGARVVATMPELYGTLMAPMAAALVAGITGLFLVQSGRGPDRRLIIAGFRPAEVIAARLGLLLGVGTVVACVAVAVLWTTFTPEAPVWFGVAVLLGAVVYGLVGALIGMLLDRLPGTYILLFGPSIDLFLFQNPAADALAVAKWLPGHYPIELALQAGLAGTPDTTVLWQGIAYTGALAALVVAIGNKRLRS